ncbi:MAG: ParB N-terminal domain-containing protein [Caulobacter sp.]|nr:ParB N-terminal domain-containing protein [Caulobacter sp.]
MSVSSQTAQDVPPTAREKGLVLADTGAVRAGEERVYPLNKLKRSPDNVRKGGHSPAAIEQRAASILDKGLIHLPVVKPERRADGSETGYGLVTAGEGRRLALRLLAKRKLIPRTVGVRCLVDERNDALAVSLDENFSREALHPADEFLAFHDLAERQGQGAETIGARFGVSAAFVRQRLRLAAVAPDVIDHYRAGDLTLDQLMAFAVTEDHDRQRQVFASHRHAQPAAIRRAMTETSVVARDRRVIFVGIDAYVAAGGTVIRDLFTEDNGGYLSDPALLDRLVADKLAAMANDLRDQEGWKWGEAHLDYPHGHGLSRVWPQPVAPTAQAIAEGQALRAEYDALAQAWETVEVLPPEVEARLSALEVLINPEVVEAYAPEALARAGVWVVLGYDGQARIERGLVRPEDAPVEPEPYETGDETGGHWGEADPNGDGGDDEATGAQPGERADADAEPEGDAAAPLSARLVADLTAHRTAALRLAISNDPDLALLALTHVLVLTTFFGGGRASCLEVRSGSALLTDHAPGIQNSPAFEAGEARYGQWAKLMPKKSEEAWDFVIGLDAASRMSLLAYCVSQTVNAVRSWDGRGAALDHAEALASAAGLDMRPFWTPSAERFLSRVTKAHVLAAIAEAVSPDTATRLSGLKKADLIAAAEPDLVKAQWLPALLRTKPSAVADGPEESPLTMAQEQGEVPTPQAEDFTDPALAAAE